MRTLYNRSRRVAAAFLLFLRSASPLASTLNQQPDRPVLAGDWAGAKVALRNPDCCVVSVPGLEPLLRALQAEWSSDPGDVDLRFRVRSGSLARDDCLRIRSAVSHPTEEEEDDDGVDDACTAALVELARGVASLADGPLECVCEDVFVRIVCASDYRARDPMFHTDKAPLRGYVTLHGPGTEFMTRPSTPLEYARLRSLGINYADDLASNMRRAEELEFIIMKGDHYKATEITSPASSWISKIWKRAFACVHRSPPGATTGEMQRRRVIVSLDLADGDDEREWYQVNTKREWRSGMTQRKSRLVA